MKIFTLTILLVVVWNVVFTQDSQKIDSLKHDLTITKRDTDRVITLADLCSEYSGYMPDTAMMYGLKGLALAQKIKFLKGETTSLYILGLLYRNMGDKPKSLELLFKGLQFARENHYTILVAKCLNSIGLTYWDLKDYPISINYIEQSIELNEGIEGDPVNLMNYQRHLAAIYTETKQFDSALKYMKKAFDKSKELKLPDNPWNCLAMGNLQFYLGNHRMALDYLQHTIQINQLQRNEHRLNALAYNSIAKSFRTVNQTDSSIYYAKKALDEASANNFKEGILVASGLLAETYESIDLKEAIYYYKITASIKEELYGAKNVIALQKILSDEQKRQRENEAQKTAYQTQIKQYALIAGLGVLLLIAIILYRNNRQKQKSNEKLEGILANLKATQSQLIQSEKMASLGELTTGIAHEIQNPLNFMNNFSEVNTELIEELEQEADKGNISQVKSVAKDIKKNEEKIIFHGKRADAIVKGMLQHSRTSSGKKELTDINAVANEYLRLSYHGLRAKDKDFNAEMKTDFDNSIGKIDIIPQDIGRVLLNLYNNAFYAMAEKSKQMLDGFVPFISVSTERMGNKVEIRVKDNGNGIPQKVVDKIFQPFFTTKPTGQGTGLGLSLSYDIIKAHGGEIKVNTGEREFTEFVVQLPISD